jgi:hypothetical protein
VDKGAGEAVAGDAVAGDVVAGDAVGDDDGGVAGAPALAVPEAPAALGAMAAAGLLDEWVEQPATSPAVVKATVSAANRPSLPGVPVYFRIIAEC